MNTNQVLHLIVILFLNQYALVTGKKCLITNWVESFIFVPNLRIYKLNIKKYNTKSKCFIFYYFILINKR